MAPVCERLDGLARPLATHEAWWCDRWVNIRLSLSDVRAPWGMDALMRPNPRRVFVRSNSGGQGPG